MTVGSRESGPRRVQRMFNAEYSEASDQHSIFKLKLDTGSMMLAFKLKKNCSDRRHAIRPVTGPSMKDENLRIEDLASLKNLLILGLVTSLACNVIKV